MDMEQTHSSETAPFSLLAIGVMFHDVLLTVPQFPAEDSKLAATSSSNRIGGNIPNSLAVLSQALPAYADVVFATAVGGDAAIWRPMIDELEALGDGNIRVLFEIRDGAGDRMPTAYIIESTATRSRSIISHNSIRPLSTETILALLWSHSLHRDHFTPHRPTDYENLLARVYNAGGAYMPSWLHFEGRDTPTIRSLISHYRRTSSPMVSVEFEKWGREGLFELVGLCDVAFFAEGWARDALVAQKGKSQGVPLEVDTPMNNTSGTPDALDVDAFFKLITVLLKPNCIAFLTIGAKGAHVFQPSHQSSTGTETKAIQWTSTYVPAPHVSPASIVETTGAGDTFIATIIYALGIRQLPPLQACKLATRVATEKCCQKGFANLVSAFEEVDKQPVRETSEGVDVEARRREGLL